MLLLLNNKIPLCKLTTKIVYLQIFFQRVNERRTLLASAVTATGKCLHMPLTDSVLFLRTVLL